MLPQEKTDFYQTKVAVENLSAPLLFDLTRETEYITNSVQKTCWLDAMVNIYPDSLC